MSDEGKVIKKKDIIAEMKRLSLEEEFMNKYDKNESNKDETVVAQEKTKLVLKISILLIIAFMGLIFLNSIFTSVPAGHVGIQDNFGSVAPNYLNAGFYFKEPWKAIISMSFQTQAYSSDASAASSDLQNVSTKITINYHLNKEQSVEVYTTNGRSYADKVIPQAVQESVKASTAKFTAEQLITNRESVKQLIESSISEKLVKYGIIVETIAITNFDFSESFNQAIEAKVTAEQRALEAKNKLEQIKIEKEQTITQAEAEAASTKLKADAEAYQLQVIQEQLDKSPDLIQYNAIQQWNGILPTVTGGAVPFINITEVSK